MKKTGNDLQQLAKNYEEGSQEVLVITKFLTPTKTAEVTNYFFSTYDQIHIEGSNLRNVHFHLKYVEGNNGSQNISIYPMLYKDTGKRYNYEYIELPIGMNQIFSNPNEALKKCIESYNKLYSNH
ncbi:hypothetical protein [Priestia megaterium]|uniref:Uncharacterized protein n=1 Tax=Priestia megaterium TaxID=1404 RepID=A0A6M6E0R2_PRIMG|nr:hypothetical protein [Priestia megaterium]QJX80420.1 hypothetical protein FDZ14_30500 [Priestia megaterium]